MYRFHYTRDAFTTSRSGLLLLASYWLLKHYVVLKHWLQLLLYFTVQYVGLHESPSLPHVQVSCSLLVIGFWTPLSTTHFRFILYFTVQYVHESYLLPHVQVSCFLQNWLLACVPLPKSAITLYRSPYTRVAFTTARSYLLLFRPTVLAIGLSNSMYSSPFSFTL